MTNHENRRMGTTALYIFIGVMAIIAIVTAIAVINGLATISADEPLGPDEAGDTEGGVTGGLPVDDPDGGAVAGGATTGGSTGD